MNVDFTQKLPHSNQQQTLHEIQSSGGVRTKSQDNQKNQELHHRERHQSHTSTDIWSQEVRVEMSPLDEDGNQDGSVQPHTTGLAVSSARGLQINYNWYNGTGFLTLTIKT